MMMGSETDVPYLCTRIWAYLLSSVFSAFLYVNIEFWVSFFSSKQCILTLKYNSMPNS